MAIVTSGDFNNIARAISVYADAAREDASLLLSTGIVGSDARITDTGEDFYGTLRWVSYDDTAAGHTDKPSPATPNAADYTAFLDANNQFERYVKNVDAIAAKENSLQSLVSKQDGLSYLGRQFGAVRARREDANLRSVLTGIGNRVWTAPVTYPSTTVTVDGHAIGDSTSGVTLEAGYLTTYTHASTSYAPLFQNDSATLAASARSDFFDVLLDAMTEVSGEFEEPFYYLVINPTTFNTLRKQNVLDAAPVQDGNLNIGTLLGGKIRLIVSGNAQDGTQTDADGNELTVTYLVKPGAVAYQNVTMNNPTAVDTNPLTNRGFGDVSIVSRWGNIIHPRGYSFSTVNAFPQNSLLATGTEWSTVAKNVNQTGIFPIFHGA